MISEKKFNENGGATSDQATGTTPEPSTGPTLDRYAKYVRQTAGNTLRVVAEDTHQIRRRKRYTLQRAAAKLLPGSRTSKCLWAVASLQYGVDVIHNTIEERSRFSGLQTCGSVWACPCCSTRISEQRKDEANHALAWARVQGYHPVLVTLTARHTRDDSLQDLLDGMRKAKRKLVNHRTYRTDIKPAVVGYITATEVTGGGVHGWHPHYHLIIFLRADSSEQAQAIARRLQDPWLASLKGVGLSGTGQGFDVRDASAAGDYVAKWGAAEELVLTSQKKAKTVEGRAKQGRNPFELLADYCERGDKLAGALFVEYAKTFKGLRQLVWSDGLKELAGVDVMTDEQAAEQEVRLLDSAKSDIRTGHFTPKEWAKVRAHRNEILVASEQGQAEGVEAVVAAIAALPSPAKKEDVETELPDLGYTWGDGGLDPHGSEAEADSDSYITIDIREAGLQPCRHRFTRPDKHDLGVVFENGATLTYDLDFG